MVMGDDSCSKGRGFESQRHILDGHLDILHIHLLSKWYCLLEKPKINEKEAEVGTFFKKKLPCQSLILSTICSALET